MAVRDVLTACLRAGLAFGQTLWTGAQDVTVTRRDPDTGETLAEVAGVTAVWRDRRAVMVPNDDGGEDRAEACRWRFPAAAWAELDWEPRRLDALTDAAGVVWVVDDCRKVGLDGVSFVVETHRLLTG